jgi:hypothetical protein
MFRLQLQIHCLSLIIDARVQFLDMPTDEDESIREETEIVNNPGRLHVQMCFKDKYTC